MILADGQIPFLLHPEIYLVYEKGHKSGHSHMFATGSFFVVSTLKQASKECKTFHFAVFAGISSAFHSKKKEEKRNWTITSRSILYSVNDLNRVKKLIKLSH